MLSSCEKFQIAITFFDGRTDEYTLTTDELIREYPFLRDYFDLARPQDFRAQQFKSMAWETDNTKVKIFPYPA